VDLGVRDETRETSGSLLTLKTSFNDTVLSINPGYKYESVLNLYKMNSDLVLNSGGELDMEYDQESTYVKANCLAHHVNDIFDTMAQSILKPISTPAGNVMRILLQRDLKSFGRLQLTE